MKPRLFFCALPVLCITSLELRAIDHKNLDGGRPLRVEDAYSIASGEWALEMGVGFTMERRNADRVFFPIEILYGAYPNFQLGLGSTLSTEPRSIDEQHKSGDLHLSALYNFNQETLSMPAFGVKGTINVPTGVGSSGADFEIKAIVTKSLSRLGLHLNAGYEFFTGVDNGQRDVNYEFALGVSWPVGAPKYTRTVLLADVFTRQSSHHGGSNVGGLEAGFRHQFTRRTVVDFGVGSEIFGPAERSSFSVTSGVSVAF